MQKKNIHIVYAFRLATRMKTYCKVRPTIEDIDEIICDYADAIFVLYRYGIYICDDPIVEYRMMENMHGTRGRSRPLGVRRMRAATSWLTLSPRSF